MEQTQNAGGANTWIRAGVNIQALRTNSCSRVFLSIIGMAKYVAKEHMVKLFPESTASSLLYGYEIDSSVCHRSCELCTQDSGSITSKSKYDLRSRQHGSGRVITAGRVIMAGAMLSRPAVSFMAVGLCHHGCTIRSLTFSDAAPVHD